VKRKGLSVASILQRSDRTAWLWAVLGAIGLNLGLFLLMPWLQRPNTEKPAMDTLVSQIQVVRLKRPERTVEPKPVAPPRVNPQKQPRPELRDMALQRPAWPFEINPRLPGGPDTLSLPAVETGLQNLGIAGLFSVGELDQPLITLVRMPPIYPLAAKRKGTEGWVTVRFIVNEQGTVEKTTIVEARPPGIFDDSVLRCVSGWRFKPGTVQGRSARVWAETTVRFELD